MYINRDIVPGWWFPTQDHRATITTDELATFADYTGNHPSFEATHGEYTPPTVQFVECHVN